MIHLGHDVLTDIYIVNSVFFRYIQFQDWFTSDILTQTFSAINPVWMDIHPLHPRSEQKLSKISTEPTHHVFPSILCGFDLSQGKLWYFPLRKGLGFSMSWSDEQPMLLFAVQTARIWIAWLLTCCAAYSFVRFRYDRFGYPWFALKSSIM